MKDKHTILGVHITDRLHEAVEVQKLLTEYGCHIKTRLGLHEIDQPGQAGDPNGILLLEMVGEDEPIAQLAEKLNAIEGVEAQSMVFHHA
jgi:hypothetical protein